LVPLRTDTPKAASDANVAPAESSN
jgi:hypothetical protein